MRDIPFLDWSSGADDILSPIRYPIFSWDWQHTHKKLPHLLRRQFETTRIVVGVGYFTFPKLEILKKLE